MLFGNPNNIEFMLMAPDSGNGGGTNGNNGGTNNGGTPDGNSNGANNQGVSNNGAGNNGDPTFETFDAFIQGQPDAIKQLFEAHINGLKGALKTERDSRAQMEKDLRKAAKDAEDGSNAQKLLNERADQLAESNRQTAFFEAAHDAGVANLRLAFLAAKEDKLLNDNGTCDFATLKTRYPQLFNAPRVNPPSGGGNGNNGTGKPPVNMNDLIRAKGLR